MPGFMRKIELDSLQHSVRGSLNNISLNDRASSSGVWCWFAPDVRVPTRVPNTKGHCGAHCAQAATCDMGYKQNL